MTLPPTQSEVLWEDELWAKANGLRHLTAETGIKQVIWLERAPGKLQKWAVAHAYNLSLQRLSEPLLIYWRT